MTEQNGIKKIQGHARRKTKMESSRFFFKLKSQSLYNFIYIKKKEKKKIIQRQSKYYLQIDKI